ncbi:MAG: hypothetical protein U5K38_05235 [Woeseiaceae bacterium]|nr:hypothetical protein [Woeseiaceae bacterium]
MCSYGVVGSKTHAKATLIVRQSPNGESRRYVHIETGNYHSVTARQYCDIGLMIADTTIGEDATELFNLLTSGPLSGRCYHEMLVSPQGVKTCAAAEDRVARAIRRRTHGNGLIQLKTNALEDADITRALYEATHAGVSVDLIVRDTCRATAGPAGLVRKCAVVISILGLLPGARETLFFHNNGSDEYLMGWADLMNRNLESRVEVLAPHPRIARAFRTNFGRIARTCNSMARSAAWRWTPNGAYRRETPAAGAEHSQTRMLQDALLRSQDGYQA